MAAASNDVLLSVRDLTVDFYTRQGRFAAVRCIGFTDLPSQGRRVVVTIREPLISCYLMVGLGRSAAEMG